MSILDGAVEYFIGRSLTKIGRGVPPLPSPPPDFRRNEFAAAGVRTPLPRNTCPWPVRRGISPFRTPINRRIRVRRDLSSVRGWGLADTNPLAFNEGT